MRVASSKLEGANRVIAIDELTQDNAVEHPGFIKAIHRFFNPVSHYELSQLEKMRGEITASEYERRKAALVNLNSTSFAQVYTMLAYRPWQWLSSSP